MPRAGLASDIGEPPALNGSMSVARQAAAGYGLVHRGSVDTFYPYLTTSNNRGKE